MTPPAPGVQRNALAPGILAALALVLSPAFPDGFGATVISFLVTVLALIVAWFAFAARQWWWSPVFVAVAVVANPIVPVEIDMAARLAGSVVVAVLFLAAGALITSDRSVP